MRLTPRTTLSLVVLLCLALLSIGAARSWLVGRYAALGERIEQTKRVVLAAAHTLQSRRQQGLRLPANDDELAVASGGIVPHSAWGEPLTYQMVGSSDFTLFAITPYPEWLVIHY